MRIKHKTVYFSVIIFLLVLVIARLALPSVLLHYAEHTLNKIPDYQVHIADVRVQLWRGRYTIEKLRVEKLNKAIPVPFFSAQEIIMAVDSSALLKGAVVGQIEIIKPQLNFVIDAKTDNEQLTIDDYWRQAVKALFPLNFNRIQISDGAVHLRDFSDAQPFDIYFYQVNAELKNLRTVIRTQQLSSTLSAQAKTMGNANADLYLKFDPLAKQTTFELAAKIEHMNLRQANDFFAHYLKLRTQSGIFSVYIEAAGKNSQVTGYIKPLIKDLKIANPTEANPIKKVYRAAAQAVTDILKNNQTDKVATRITMTGKLDNPELDFWSLLGNLLKNAFIQALWPEFDPSFKADTIDITQGPHFKQ